MYSSRVGPQIVYYFLTSPDKIIKSGFSTSRDVLLSGPIMNLNTQTHRCRRYKVQYLASALPNIENGLKTIWSSTDDKWEPS